MESANYTLHLIAIILLFIVLWYFISPCVKSLLKDFLCKEENVSGIYVTFTVQTLSKDFITFKSKHMAVILSDTQFVEGQVQTVNKKGKPAPIQTGSIEYSSSNEAVFTVTENPDDETKFTVTAVGAGTGQLNYSADADLGEGVVPISGFTDIEVTPAQATAFNVTFGQPQEQPEPTI